MVGLLIIPLLFGLVGSITPCALGINTVLLSYLTGKPRLTRIREWLLIALPRALVLTVLGLAFGLAGQVLSSFVREYQYFIAFVIIALGVVFILSRFVPIPLPGLHLPGSRLLKSEGSAVALGIVFGLDIPACTSPLVFALLAQTVMAGNWLSGVVSLFVFGIGMSLPLLALTLFEATNRLLVAASQRYKTAFYVIAGFILIVLGVSELSPRIMAITGGWLQYVAKPLWSLW